MRTWRLVIPLAGVLWVPVAAALAPAQSLRIKMATQAPDGSAWHRILEDLGHEWRQATDGRVRLRIYAGQVAGDDREVLRRIRHRQLHGATLVGLSDLDPAFRVFQIPLFYDSPEEFFYVLERMSPMLKERVEAKGFVVLHWGYGGWLHLFAKRRTPTVEELKELKMRTTSGNDRMVRLWRQNGFHPVPLTEGDVMVGLQSGMIDALPSPPYVALAFQWFRHTPYMIAPGFSPLLGAAVVDERTWAKISQADRAAMLEAAERAEERLLEEIPQKDDESVLEMEQRGLQVITVRLEGEEDPWRRTAEDFAESFRAAMVPEDIFDLAVGYRDAFRRGGAAAAGSQP